MSLYAEFTQEDDNAIVPLEAKWQVEYVCHRGILGDRVEPPTPCELTIISTTLIEVHHYYNKHGYELKNPIFSDVERHLRKWLDEDELVECCIAHWEALDDEGRRVA